MSAKCHERPLVTFLERTIEWLLDFETRHTAYAYNSAFAVLGQPADVGQQ